MKLIRLSETAIKQNGDFYFRCVSTVARMCWKLLEIVEKKIQEKTSHHIHVCLLSCFVLVLWMDLFQFRTCQKNVFLWCSLCTGSGSSVDMYYFAPFHSVTVLPCYRWSRFIVLLLITHIFGSFCFVPSLDLYHVNDYSNTNWLTDWIFFFIYFLLLLDGCCSLWRN